MNGEAGKGGAYRPVNRRKYDREYLRIYGEQCPVCHGRVSTAIAKGCETCDGLGYVEKKRGL